MAECTGVVVYIVERGCYEDRDIVGVFDLPERAMAAFPMELWTRTVWTHYPRWPQRTPVDHYQTWINGKDWDDKLEIIAVEFTNDGPLQRVNKILIQTLKESGGWDYVEGTDEQADALIVN